MTVHQPARGPNRVEVALGALLERAIQTWVRVTGRAVSESDVPWLAGPIGSSRIGASYYQDFADQEGLTLSESADAGLLDDFFALAAPGFDVSRVDARIANFYEHTAVYQLAVLSRWSGPLRPFAHTLIYLVSRSIEQLNLPRSAGGQGDMDSRVISLEDPDTHGRRFAGWLRTAATTGAVIYAGFYTTSRVPNHDATCVKVVFPLPSGSATVILRPENGPDGSLRLVSHGRRFGDPGYYRIHRTKSGRLRVKYLPLREIIHVYNDAGGTLRTDHIFMYWNLVFLRLHYRMTGGEARLIGPSR